ncbi:MAG: MBL fold metallo-hydrolase [Armatimonadota bacterium]|nr:MBL fold metallo-hydrolase [Armatimonadota bacterium]MDR5702877.1 MBL fold metallo-hydrolase [Armatimonadota bacterium]
MEEVRRGIFRLQVEMPGPLGSVNCFLLEGGGEVVLVDTGPDVAVSRQALMRELRALGKRLEEITRILITHGHPDHCGFAKRARQDHGIPFWIHPLDAEYYARMHRGELTLQAQTWIRHEVPEEAVSQIEMGLWGMMGIVQEEIPWDSCDIPREVPDQKPMVFHVGEMEWRVFHTPGHSPGHVCLYEPHLGILLSGDLVLPQETPHIGLDGSNSGDPLANYLASLHLLESLPARLVLPGHGEPFHDLGERILELRAHHQERLHLILEAVREGAQGIYEVAQRIRWTPKKVSFGELDPINQFLALQEAAAHLEHLVARNCLQRIPSEGPTRFVFLTEEGVLGKGL